MIQGKAKRITAFCSTEAIQKSHVLCAPGAHSNLYSHNRMEWQIKSMPLPKEMDAIESKSIMRNLIGEDGDEQDQ